MSSRRSPGCSARWSAIRLNSFFFCSRLRVVADGQLDERQLVGIGDPEVARRVHDLRARPMLGDDLKQVVLRHIERLDQRLLHAPPRRPCDIPAICPSAGRYGPGALSFSIFGACTRTGNLAPDMRRHRQIGPCVRPDKGRYITGGVRKAQVGGRPDRVGCVTLQTLAARVKCFSRARAAKYWSWRISILARCSSRSCWVRSLFAKRACQQSI